MIRRPFDLVLVAVVPWALACLIGVAETMVFDHSGTSVGQGIRDQFSLMGVLVPVVVLLVALFIDTIRRRNTFSVLRRRRVVGGWFAGWSTVTIAALGLLTGGAYGFVYMSGWAFLSGYVGLLWLAGTLVWATMSQDSPDPHECVSG